MPPTFSFLSLLLLSGNLDIQSQVKHIFKDASVTIAKNAAALPKDMARRLFDAVIIESKPGSSDGMTPLPPSIDLTHSLVITGSRPVLKRASKFMHVIARQKAVNGKDTRSLEDYLEWKMGDFVKGMKSGSGRNLHPMLISVIERPLIARSLEQTNGNQIQAAALLGLNRNTLRKKIKDLNIPVKRKRAAQRPEA